MSRSPRSRFWRQEEKWKEQEMKRSLTMHVRSAGRSLRALVTSAMLFLALTATSLVVSPSAALGKDLFYTTSGAGFGLPNGAEIFAITVSGAKVSSWRPSTRAPGGRPCLACLSPDSLSWPSPSAQTGRFTQLEVATPIR